TRSRCLIIAAEAKEPHPPRVWFLSSLRGTGLGSPDRCDERTRHRQSKRAEERGPRRVRTCITARRTVRARRLFRRGATREGRASDDRLTERQPAVVRGHLPVNEHLEPVATQLLRREPEEQHVLK